MKVAKDGGITESGPIGFADELDVGFERNTITKDRPEQPES